MPFRVPSNLCLGLAAAAVFALVACMPGCASVRPVQPSGIWARASTPAVTVSTDLGTARARQVARKIEVFRGAVAEVLPELREDPEAPLPVWVFSASRDYEVYATALDVPPGVRSVFITTPGGGVILADGEVAGGHLLGMLYHELIHDFAMRVRPGMPLWLNEGLAELFGIFESDGIRAEIGNAVPSYLELLSESGMGDPGSWMRAKPRSATYREPTVKSLFHARTWLLVHYLVVGNPDLSQGIPGYLDRVERGQSHEKALEAAFGLDTGELGRRMAAYALKKDFPVRCMRIPVDHTRLDPHAAPLEDARVLFELGWMLLGAGSSRIGLIAAHFEESLETNPHEPGALAGLANVRLRQGRLDEARELLRKAGRLRREK
jgi:hypothetical protein